MKRYRQAVSALVLRISSGRRELLLVHKPRMHDAWQLPQGGVESGETVEQAAIRELSEETGLAIDCIDHRSATVYRYDFPPRFIERHHPTNDGQELSFVIIHLENDQEIHVDRHEIDGYRWIVPEELSAFIKRKEYREVIFRVLREADSL